MITVHPWRNVAHLGIAYRALPTAGLVRDVRLSFQSAARWRDMTFDGSRTRLIDGMPDAFTRSMPSSPASVRALLGSLGLAAGLVGCGGTTDASGTGDGGGGNPGQHWGYGNSASSGALPGIPGSTGSSGSSIGGGFGNSASSGAIGSGSSSSVFADAGGDVQSERADATIDRALDASVEADSDVQVGCGLRDGLACPPDASDSFADAPQDASNGEGQ